MTEETPAPPKTRRTVIIATVAGVLVLAGAYALYTFSVGAEPTRLFVAVEGCGERCDGAIRAELVRRFAELGLEALPDPADDPPVTNGVEEAVAAARASGAAHALHVGLEIRSERDGLRPGSRFIVVAATAEVRAVDEAVPPGPTRVYVLGGEGDDRADALARTTRTFATTIHAETAGDLFAMPALAARLEDPDSFGDLETKARFDRAVAKRNGQARTRARYEEECATTAGEIVEEGEVRCATEGCAETYLFGVDADGTNALVHVDTPTVYVPFDTSPAPRSGETAERIELRPRGDGEPRVLAEASNFFGYGSLSEDGRTAAFVEQGDARFGVVVLDVETGARRVIDLAERPAMAEQARLSPDGRFVAWFVKPFARGTTEVRVAPASGGAHHPVAARTMRSIRWVNVPFEQGGERRLAIATVGSTAFRGEVTAFLHDPVTAASVSIDTGERVVRSVVGSHEGALYLVASTAEERHRCVLGVRRPDTLETSFVPLDACIDDAYVLPDGRIVAVAVVGSEGDASPDDSELVLVDPATGAVVQRTDNAVRERYPRPSSDGRFVAFERRASSRFRGVHPNAICWLEP